MICPNVNLQEWKDLVKEVGEDRAYARWNYGDATLAGIELKRDKPVRGELGKLVDKIKIYIEKKIAILDKKKILDKSKKEKELKTLKEHLKTLGEVDTINEFIEDAYERTVEAERLFEKLQAEKDTLPREKIMTHLTALNDFINGYSILDEISRADLEEVFGKKLIGIQGDANHSAQAKLRYAIDAKKDLKNAYLNVGLPILADWLLESKSEKLSKDTLERIAKAEKDLAIYENSTTLKESVKERKIKETEELLKKLRPYDLTRDALIEQLKVADKDISVVDFWFSPLISSEDSVLSLFAKSIKGALEDARIKDIKARDEISKEFDKFAKANPNSKDNVDKFNSQIVETNTVESGEFDKNGLPILIKEKAFVQKFNQTKWNKARKELFDRIGKKPENPGKAQDIWDKAYGDWLRTNTKPKSAAEIERITKIKKKELLDGAITKDEYNSWYSKQIHEYKGVKQYKRDFAEPSDIYKNDNWSELYTEDGKPKNAAGEYHKFMTEKYFEQQKRLPKAYQKGYTLPSIPKSDLERAQTQNLLHVAKTKLKEAVKYQSYDNAAGITDLGGKDAMLIPVLHTQRLDADEVTSDVYESILQFESMTNRYEALNNIQGEITLMKQVMGERQTIETTHKGAKIIDAFARKHGYEDYIKKNGESYSELHVKAFIDMVVSGEMMKKEEILGLSAGKMINTLTGLSATTTLALDFLKATANNIQGNIQVMIEANSGEHFSKANVRSAAKFYLKNTGAMIGDFGKSNTESLAGKMIDLYDGIQGSFSTKFGKNVSGSVARKLLRTDTLFFNQHMAEHEVQVKALFAILDGNVCKDTKTGETITVLEAYEKYGIDIESHTDFTEKQRREIMNTHHAIAKRLHGVYNDFDKGTIQRYALGRALMLYRKFLIPSVKRRWKDMSADEEAGVYTEGFYRVFWRTFARDIRDLKFNVANNWSTYNDYEKAQIKKVIAELSFILAATALIVVLKSAGDDDDDLKKGKGFSGYMYNLVLYQAVRQRSETFAYLNLYDAFRIIKSPSALNTTLDRALDLQKQLFWEWDPEKLTYHKKTGTFEKGTNKSWAYTLKLMGLSGYNANPEEAVRAFEAITQ